MTPLLQQRVFEVHPEVSFSNLAKGPAKLSKKRRAGREERIKVLLELFPDIQEIISTNKRPGVNYDDIIDAYRAAWTAIQIDLKKALRIPEKPIMDSKGLRMEIWY